MKIRTGTLNDCPSIAALVVALARERDGHLPDAAAVSAAAAECVNGNASLLIADEDGEVVGYLAVHWIPFPLLSGREGYISDLVISKGCRGRGVGTALLEAATECANAQRCVRLSLNNRITSEAFTRGFFTGAGFRQRTEFANFVRELGPLP